MENSTGYYIHQINNTYLQCPYKYAYSCKENSNYFIEILKCKENYKKDNNLCRVSCNEKNTKFISNSYDYKNDFTCIEDCNESYPYIFGDMCLLYKIN